MLFSRLRKWPDDGRSDGYAYGNAWWNKARRWSHDDAVHDGPDDGWSDEPVYASTPCWSLWRLRDAASASDSDVDGAVRSSTRRSGSSECTSGAGSCGTTSTLPGSDAGPASRFASIRRRWRGFPTLAWCRGSAFVYYDRPSSASESLPGLQ